MSITVINGDARYLPLPDDSVHLAVTSPPYNVGLTGYGRIRQNNINKMGSRKWECQS